MKTEKAKRIREELTIIEFIRHPQLLNDQSNSTAQDTVLKSTYGLDLTEAETDIYRRSTGRDYVAREQREITTLAGRRGGKTSKTGARIALYEAFRDHHLPRGERAYVLLIASSLEQAEIAYDYICKDIRSSPILLKKVAKFRKNEVVLKNGITICCCTCSSISVRGRAVVAAICDEVCFWRNEVTSVHCDEEVLAALRPAMIQFPKSKLIKISTPHAKRGVIWEEYRRRAELSYPVFQLTTQEMNPHVPAKLLEQERERSLERFKREFLAEFTDNVVSWISPEYLDACIIPGRQQLPRVSDGFYVAAVDPAFKQSDFALAIAHRTSAGLIVIDRIARWTGSTKAPLGFERVCREIAEILREYGIDNLQGDQFAAAIIQQEFLKLNITYKEVTFNRQTRVRLFNNLKHLLQQRRIELLDLPELLRQLRSLEESLASDGSIDVRPDYGKDDLAIVLGMCALELSQSSCVQPSSPITLGRASRPWDGRLPFRVSERGGFPVGQNCSKFPKCWEVGPCVCFGIE